MSLVISHVGWDFVTIGADRGTWAMSNDGKPINHCIMARSKIHQIPGTSVVIATVGAWYDGWIEHWIVEHPVRRDAYSVPDIAKSFVADYFRYHRPKAQERLADAGLSLEDGQKLPPETPQRRIAGASVIVAGMQPGWPRAQVWHADFPRDSEPLPLHYEVAPNANGGLDRIEKAAILTMGNSTPIRPIIENLDSTIPKAKESAELIESLLEIVNSNDRCNPTPESPRLLPPFDIVRIGAAGVEWLNGCEGPVIPSQPAERKFRGPVAMGSPKFYAGFDSFGNAQSSAMLKAKVPNSLANLLSDIALSADGGSSGSTQIKIWMVSKSGNSANPAGGQYPAWIYPDGSGGISPAASNCGSSSSPLHTFTGLTSGAAYYFVIGYDVNTGLFTNTSTIYSASPTQAQIATVVGDGTVVAVVATANSGSSITPGGGVHTVTGGGGRQVYN